MSSKITPDHLGRVAVVYVRQSTMAQVIGNLLPLTYFNRLIRGIMLKGNGWTNSWPSVWPLMVFTLVVMTVAVKTYRRTLD